MDAETALKIATRNRKVSAKSIKVNHEIAVREFDKWVKNNVKKELARIYKLIRSSAKDEYCSAVIYTLGAGVANLNKEEQAKIYRSLSIIIGRLQKRKYRITKEVNILSDKSREVNFIAYWD